MIKMSRIGLFARQSFLAKKPSFVNPPNDSSSADKVNFYQTHEQNYWAMPMHGNYGAFIGGVGLYQRSLDSLISARQSAPYWSPATVGIAFQDTHENVVKF
jgi:hypothetical protein